MLSAVSGPKLDPWMVMGSPPLVDSRGRPGVLAYTLDMLGTSYDSVEEETALCWSATDTIHERSLPTPAILSLEFVEEPLDLIHQEI